MFHLYKQTYSIKNSFGTSYESFVTYYMYIRMVDLPNQTCMRLVHKSHISRKAMLFESFSQKGFLCGVMVKDVRHCSARCASLIRGFNPNKVEIFIWIMSRLWLKKTSVAATY